jgi:hypothetical protein
MGLLFAHRCIGSFSDVSIVVPEEMKKFVEAGNIKKCGDIVGKASRWVMEILLEKGAIEL